MSTTTIITKESKQFNLCEIAENNGKSGKPLWLIYKDEVYDITKFVNLHPGGVDLILEYGGKDATKAFTDIGHSSEALRELKSTKIGVVSPSCLDAVEAHSRKNKRFKFFRLFC